MIFNRDQLQKPFKSSLLITVIANESNQNNIKYFFQEQLDNIYSRRISINCLASVDDFKIDKSYEKNPTGQGLINLQWIQKTMTVKTSVCIIVNQLKSEVSFRDEERKWIKDIQKIKATSLDTIIYLILLTGTIPIPSDTDERSDSIYKQKDCKIFTFESLEAIKKSSEVRKIHMNVISSSKDYYRAQKQKYKKRINDLSIKVELRIKAYIKIGILAWIKNKKPKAKHFEEAYRLICNYTQNDISKYLYGTDALLNFCQIRGAADWLFCQICKISKSKNEMSKDAFIIRANQHYNKFSSNIFIDMTEGNFYHIFDLYWCFTFNEFIGFEISSTIDSVIISKNFPGFYYLKGLYCLMRIMNQLSLFENIILSTVIIDNKKYSVDAIKKVNGKFYEKPVVFIDNKDVLNPKHVLFNIELYFRYFLLENNINVIALSNKISQILIPNILMTFEAQVLYAIKAKPQENNTNTNTNNAINSKSTSASTPMKNASSSVKEEKQMNCMNDIFFYLNVINLPPSILEYQISNITRLHELLISSKNLWKYPIVYYAYLNKAIQMWMNMLSPSVQEKAKLFKSLLLLGNHRDLNDKEEAMFLQLLTDNELRDCNALSSPISIKVSKKDDSLNRIFSFDHIIKGGNNSRNILELVDFEFTIKTCLKSKPLKFTSITVYFGYEKRKKEFTQFDNEVTSTNELIFNYQILLKANEQALMLKKIEFKFEGVPYLFEYFIHLKKENVVLVKQSKKSVLEFNMPKIVMIGVNQYYQIKCDIVKDESANVEIGSVTIDFEKKISISEILTKAPAIQSNISNNPPVTKPFKPATSSIRNTFENISANSSSMKNTFEKSSEGNTSMKSTFEKADQNTSIKSLFEKTPTAGSSMRSTFEQLANINNPLSTMTQSIKMSDILKASSTSAPQQNPQPIPQSQHQPQPQSIIPQEVKIPETIPEFYILEQDGSITKKEDKGIFKIENYESSNKNISFLIKFNSIGKSTIGFLAKYRIIKREFTDDQVESKETGRIVFEIIDPFEIKYNIESNIYMTSHSKPQFNTNSKIKVNLVIKNLLDTNLSIDALSIEPQSDSTRIMTPITKVLSLPKEINESVLTIRKSSTYVIPFEVYYTSEANGVCGYCNLDWSTKDLKSFSSTMTNCKRFELPEITALDFQFDISYVVPNEISFNCDFELIIRLHNKEREFKRIVLLIDTSNEFALVGKLKNRMLMYPNEIKNVSIKMIPLTKGKIKLPSCKISLFSIQKYEGKLYSIYYLPNFIFVKPS